LNFSTGQESLPEEQSEEESQQEPSAIDAEESVQEESEFETDESAQEAKSELLGLQFELLPRISPRSTPVAKLLLSKGSS